MESDKDISRFRFLLVFAGLPAVLMLFSALLVKIANGHLPLPEFFSAWGLALFNAILVQLINRMILGWRKGRPFRGLLIHVARFILIVIAAMSVYHSMGDPKIFLIIFIGAFFAFRISVIILLLLVDMKKT